MTVEQLVRQKKRFLDQYNTKSSQSNAASDAIKSAVQHNSLYAPGVSASTKNEIVVAWKSLLEKIASGYVSLVKESQYEADIASLKTTMNERFSAYFRYDRHPRFDYDPGFRISHAQKSLSVFLKHLWCMDEVEMPPQCPVDRIVLVAAGASELDAKWTGVNSIQDHRTKVAMLTLSAGRLGLPLAEWELVTFKA